MQKALHFLILTTTALITAGSLVAAAPPTATFLLNSAGSGANLGGVYTSPYTGQINGGPTIPVICDDFVDDSYVPETWTAYVTQLSDVVAGTYAPDPYLYWTTGAGGLNQVQAYSVAAVLAFDILQSPTGSQQQEDYSFAMWGLFDSPNAFSPLSNPDLTNAITYLNDAISYTLNSANAAQVQADVNATTIYSYNAALNPTGPSCGGNGCAHTPPQEFIAVNMPEPSSPALLGFDLVGIGALVFFVRRRKASAVN